MYKRPIVWLLLLLSTVSASQAEQEFLRPDQAFLISGRADDAQTLRISWQIADGYYMYQSKFRFQSDTPGVEFGQPDLPPSITKDDPIFGEVEIYRDTVTIDVPLASTPGNADMIAVKARSQGCADDGICYPPHTQTVLLELTEAADLPELAWAGAPPSGAQTCGASRRTRPEGGAAGP